jgi:hypothetical protein
MRTKLLLLPLFVLACGGREPSENLPPPLRTIEKNSALETANANFRSVVVGGARSGAFMEDHQLVGGLLRFGDAAAPEPDPTPTEPTLEADANEMADELRARILTVANVELEEPTRIVLSMKPEAYCASTSSSTGSDSSCAQMLAATPIRLELTSRREGDVDAALTIGTFAVGTIAFHQDLFAVEIDLGAAVDAAEALAAASGEPTDLIQGTVRGRIRIELKINGANDYTLSLSILSPIDIDATIDGQTLMYNIGVSTPLASLRLDGNTPQAVFESNVGGIDLMLPLGLFSGSDGASPEPEPAPEPTGTLGVRVEPTSFKATIDTTNTVKIDRYSSGGVTATYNGIEILSYSINAGQPLSGSVTLDENSTTFSVNPMLDVRAMFDFNPLVDQLDSDFPPQLLRDTLQLALNGAQEPTVRTSSYETTTVDEFGNTIVDTNTQFEVVEGRLTLSSSAAGKTVVVEAGMCLDTIEPDPNATTEPHPFELLVATTCAPPG